MELQIYTATMESSVAVPWEAGDRSTQDPAIPWSYTQRTLHPTVQTMSQPYSLPLYS